MFCCPAWGVWSKPSTSMSTWVVGWGVKGGWWGGVGGERRVEGGFDKQWRLQEVRYVAGFCCRKRWRLNETQTRCFGSCTGCSTVWNPAYDLTSFFLCRPLMCLGDGVLVWTNTVKAESTRFIKVCSVISKRP